MWMWRGGGGGSRSFLLWTLVVLVVMLVVVFMLPVNLAFDAYSTTDPAYIAISRCVTGGIRLLAVSIHVSYMYIKSYTCDDDADCAVYAARQRYSATGPA
jgi:hypothetical protein